MEDVVRRSLLLPSFGVMEIVRGFDYCSLLSKEAKRVFNRWVKHDTEYTERGKSGPAGVSNDLGDIMTLTEEQVRKI